METEKDVKTGGSSNSVTVDEKGVPLENREKELERLRQIKSELEQTRQEVAELKVRQAESAKVEPTQEQLDETARDEILKFAKAPKPYLVNEIEAYLQTREMKESVTKVVPWLEQQAGYKPEDNARLLEIEREYGLAHPNLLERAKTAWNILQKDRLVKELETLKSESRRETTLNQSMSEGSGKSVQQTNKPKRSELLAELAKAEKEHNRDRSNQILGLLEDVKD